MSAVAPPAASARSIDDLDSAIVRLAARINAATHDLLILVRQFDERGGWLKWGFASCADWLAWRCDLGIPAARERVRVAHAIKRLPAIDREFVRGRLSYSKVRALTRVASRDNEESLLRFALETTAARVEERCREIHWASPGSTDNAASAHVRRALTVRRDERRGTMTITVELPLETGELVSRALDRARDDVTTSGPEFAKLGWQAMQADALVAVAGAYLGGQEATGGMADNYLVTVHVDHTALATGRGRSGLPLETARRLACDGERVTIIEDGKGEPLDVGRKTRAIPAALRRALWARDRGCRFPGCTHKRFVDGHHVKHWAQQGETCLDNLLLLCTQHHTLVHEGGFTIEKDYRDRWFFRRPDGRAVPDCGYRAADMLDDPQSDSSRMVKYVSAETRHNRNIASRAARELPPPRYCLRAA